MNAIPATPATPVTLGPTTPVPIDQIEEEFAQAIKLYRQAEPRRVLEIGTYAGGTLYHWLENATPGTSVVSVDIDMSYLEQEVADSWAPAGVDCALIEGDTKLESVQEAVRGYGPFDWLFIDGNHEYEYVRNDFDAFLPMCNPGAYILLHDIALRRDYGDGRTAGVELLWRQIQAEGYWTAEIRARPVITEYGGPVLLACYGIGVLRLP